MMKLKVSELVIDNKGVEFYRYIGVYKDKTVDEIKAEMQKRGKILDGMIGYKIYTTDEKKKNIILCEERF